MSKPSSLIVAVPFALLALLIGGPAALASDPVERPNIIFLLSDDLAHDSVARTAELEVPTPALDRLAAEGVRFQNAFVTTSVCCPARLSFLTGRYARGHGVLTNIASGGRVKTFANHLKKAGYDTGYFGKWHLRVAGETQPGFATTAIYEGQGRYDDCAFVIDGRPTPTKGWVDDIATDYALDFLRAEREKPFLLCLGFKSPHGPYRPASRHDELFASATIEPPANATARPPFPRRIEFKELAQAARKHPNSMLVDDDWAEGIDRSEFDRWKADRVKLYLRHVIGVDENVGRVLAALDELDLAANTLVVFASDNGFALGHHGVFGKRSAYEESMRIALMARWPNGFAGGQEVDELVLNVDVAPTLLAAAGAAIPGNVDGESLLPLLSESAPAWRDHFVYEYFWEPDARPNVSTIFAVRTRRHKLVMYLNRPSWTQLFDLERDPLEQSNLANDAQSAALRAELEALLIGADETLGQRPNMGR